MRLAPLFFSGLLVLGGITTSSNALAHGYRHDQGHGKWGYQYDARRHWRHGHHRYRYPHWRKRHWRDHHWPQRYRHWRPHHGDDSWYGIHLFFGGR